MGIILGLLLPFAGTAAGAACVFVLQKQIGPNVQRVFTGFAAGVMVAASVWSLIIPAIDMSGDMGKLSFLPAVVGFLAGIFFLLLMDSVIPHLHVGSEKPEGKKSGLGKTAMLMLAVTIHNFPEGAACGAILAGVLSGEGDVTMAGAIALSVGIAVQNFPEGAIISLPLRSEETAVGNRLRWGLCPELWNRLEQCLLYCLRALLLRFCRICLLSQRELCCMWWWRN